MARTKTTARKGSSKPGGFAFGARKSAVNGNGNEIGGSYENEFDSLEQVGRSSLCHHTVPS
jgi:hypothetical protein